MRGTERHWYRRVGGPARLRMQTMHTAIWSPAPGAEPEGYILYQFEDAGGAHRFAIREWVALSCMALEGMLGFVANHDSRTDQVLIRALPDWPLWHLLADPGVGENGVQPAFQLRLVDLAAAFAERPWPADLAGSLTIGVSDSHAPWNQGTWLLSFEGGRAAVRSTKIDSPDLMGSMEVWSQIYAGSLSPVQALRMGRLTATNPAAVGLLHRATPGDPLFFHEFF